MAISTFPDTVPAKVFNNNTFTRRMHMLICLLYWLVCWVFLVVANHSKARLLVSGTNANNIFCCDWEQSQAELILGTRCFGLSTDLEVEDVG